MSCQLISGVMGLRISPEEGTWEAWPLAGKGPRLGGVEMSLQWRRRGRRYRAPIRLQDAMIEDPREVAMGLGRCRSVVASMAPDPNGLALRVEWRVGVDVPLILWRVVVVNQRGEPILLDRIDVLRIEERRNGIVAAAGDDRATRLWSSGHSGDLRFFTHGWQSWGYAGALGSRDHHPRSRLGPFTSPRLGPDTPHPAGRGHFGSDMFGVVGNRADRSGILVGFLSQRLAFGCVEAWLASSPPKLTLWANADGVRLDPGVEFGTDWACLQYVDLDAESPLEPYLEAVARENQARTDGPTPVGWCSWYYFLQHVTQEDILANLAWAADHRPEVPLRLIQIDDGFEADVGNWFERAQTFPDDLSILSRRIRQAGFQPGLWLAPFIVKPAAKLAREHPDWILRGTLGLPANAGFNWNTFTRALDVTHPAVLDWVRNLTRTAVKTWGFDYLKLDFLFAAAIPGNRYDPACTGAQALFRALSVIREEAGPAVTLVGCGCPLGSGIGVFDAMRIGEDVAARWEPALNGIEFLFKQEPDFPSARHSIRNTLTRAPLHRRWWVNDPDCLLVREGRRAARSAAGGGDAVRLPFAPEAHLTAAEVQTLATAIALSAGSMVVSDHLPELSEERCTWMARLIPPLPRAARAADWMDANYPARLVLPLSGPAGSWHLVALLNWSDKPQVVSNDLVALGLPRASAYHVVDFWAEAYRLQQGSMLASPRLEPHGAYLAALRPIAAAPQYLGDTLHVSQGLSVRRWQPSEQQVEVAFALGRRGAGTVWLSLPSEPVQATCAGEPVSWQHEAPSIFSFQLAVDGQGVLQVRWQ